MGYVNVCVSIRGKVCIGGRTSATPRYWEEVVNPTCLWISLATFYLGPCG